MSVLSRQAWAEAKERSLESRVLGENQRGPMAVKSEARIIVQRSKAKGAHVHLKEIHILPAQNLLPGREVPLLRVATRNPGAFSNREVAPTERAFKQSGPKGRQAIAHSLLCIGGTQLGSRKFE